MPDKTVSISARISQDDAEFLSQLIVSGAKTPSDKLRAILMEARQRHLGQQEYSDGLRLMRDMYAPLTERLQQAEYESGQHSELLVRLMQWLPDIAAYVLSGVPNEEKGIQKKELVAFEHGVVDRVFRLMESMLQLGITQNNPCYDPKIINDRIKPVLELADTIARLR